MVGRAGHRESACHLMDSTVVRVCTQWSYGPRFESWLAHFLAVEPWLNNLTSVYNGNEGCTTLIELLQELIEISDVLTSTDYAPSYCWLLFSLFILGQREPLESFK